MIRYSVRVQTVDSSSEIWTYDKEVTDSDSLQAELQAMRLIENEYPLEVVIGSETMSHNCRECWEKCGCKNHDVCELCADCNLALAK